MAAEQPRPPPTQEPVPPAHVMAAKKGCALCCGRIRVPPAGPPFQAGPYVGRYLCADCWTLYYEKNPGDLSDEDTKKFVSEESKRIGLRRQASVVYEDGPNRVYVSARKTLVFEIHLNPDLAPLEFDAAKLAWLIKALIVLQTKPPAEGFEIHLCAQKTP